MNRNPAPQAAQARNAFNLPRTIDARILDQSINERGWTLEADDYIARIQSGQTLRSSFRDDANSYL